MQVTLAARSLDVSRAAGVSRAASRYKVCACLGSGAAAASKAAKQGLVFAVKPELDCANFGPFCAPELGRRPK